MTTAAPQAIKTDAQVRAARCPPDLVRVDFPVSGTIGLQLRVSPSGSKTWRVRGRATGSQTLGAFPGMGLAEARATAMQIIGAAKRQQRSMATSGAVAAPVDRRTLADLLDDFEKAKGARLRSWPEQRRSIEARYRVNLRKPALQLDAKTVRRPVERDRSVAAKRACIYLCGVLRWAKIGQPVSQSELNDLVVERPRSRTLIREEIRAVLTLPPSTMADYVRALLLCAQRRGDVANMRWDAIDFDRATWTFEMQKSRDRATVALPLSDRMLELLERRRATATSDFVFGTRAKTPIANFSRLLDQARAASKTEGWSLHDLRRTARTCLSRAGVRPDIAERALGHAVWSPLARIYDTYSFEAEIRDAFNVLAQHFDALTGENVVMLRKPDSTG